MSDALALGVLDARPELSVVGFDDIPAAAAAGLTTIRQDHREKGRRAARMVLTGERGERRVALRAHFTPKCSSTIGVMSRSAHCSRTVFSGPVPVHSRVALESLACSEPCEPPPMWCAPPQSRNS